MKILLNDGIGKRKEVEVEVVKELPTCVYVKLPDGNIIKRKKARDIPLEGRGENAPINK